MEKKLAHAAEQDRADVLRRRWAWFKGQLDLDSARLVFIDETWASTNMARVRGRAPRGERLRAGIPHGHWKVALSDGVNRITEVAQMCQRSAIWTALGGTLAGAIGVGAGPVAGDHLDARMGLQPAGQRLGRAVWQRVQNPVPLEVHQHRAVAVAAPPRDVIHPEHTDGSPRLS